MAEAALTRLNRKAVAAFGLVALLLLIQRGDGFQFKVGGGSGSWSVPSDPNAAVYNQWAEKNRFQIDDTLLFVYDAREDSVLHVTKDDYTNCNTAAPLQKFTDGHTAFKFNQSGAHYFISGVADHCHRNEKLHVVVLADRRKQSKQATLPPPSAPFAEVPPPSLVPPTAPSGGVPPPSLVPPTAPSAGVPPPSLVPPPGNYSEVPPPSLAPPGGEYPAPPPEEYTSSNNGASSFAASVVGAIACFVGSSLALAI